LYYDFICTQDSTVFGNRLEIAKRKRAPSVEIEHDLAPLVERVYEVLQTNYYCKQCSNPSLDKYFWIHPECLEQFHTEDFQALYQTFAKRRGLRVTLRN
jgi:hypothetical protein